MRSCRCGVFLALALGCAAPVRAEPIGRVRTLDGEAWIQRGDTRLLAAVGVTVQRGDVIRTGKPGAVGIVLDDDTTISLGSGSELALREYGFDPAAGRFALVVRMVRGTFAYLAGAMAKLAPDAIQLQLPDATIAVRGTKLLVCVEE